MAMETIIQSSLLIAMGISVAILITLIAIMLIRRKK